MDDSFPFQPLDHFQNHNDLITPFEFNPSNNNGFSALNNSATVSDFYARNSNLYASKELKTTRSGVVYDVPKAENIIQNPGIYELNGGFPSLKTLKFSTLRTPSGNSKYEKYEDLDDIETAALQGFGSITRSGRVYGRENYDVGSPAETLLDETTLNQVRDGINFNSLKRPMCKVQDDPIASVISENKKPDFKNLKFDLSTSTTRPVSYQDSLNQESGIDSKFRKIECNDSCHFGQNDNYGPHVSNFGLNLNGFNNDNAFSTDISPGNYFLDHLHSVTPLVLDPDVILPKPVKKPRKLIKTETKKSSKIHRCRINSCRMEFDRNDLLKRHQKIHSKIHSFTCTECKYTCNRKDNLDNHMRIHFHAKPYICPYAQYKNGNWEPCLYAAARQDDLTKHCIGTAVCHLEKFSTNDDKNHSKSGFPIPAKVMNKKNKFKLRMGHDKLSERLYREYVNQSADFMYVVELKIMKKWTAVWNAAVKKKDEKTKLKLRQRQIPNLMQGQNYDFIKDKVFTNPQFEFCDVILNLNQLDVRCLFKNYQLGNKVEDKHINPSVQAWGDLQTHDWKRRVAFQIQEQARLKNRRENAW